MFGFDENKLMEKLNENLKDLKVSNVLINAMKNLDYETYIKLSSENNPAAELVDPKKAMPEDDFNEIKEGLTAAAALAGLKSTLEMIGDMNKDVSKTKPNDANDDSIDVNVEDLFKGFSKIDMSAPNQESESNVERRIKLTGEHGIDAEIIFNLIKNRNK